MSPETRLSETPPLIRFGPPSSVSVKAPEVRLLVLIGSLKVTSIDETYELRGLGETGVNELTDSADRIWTVCWAEPGVAWTLPALSVAMV